MPEAPRQRPERHAVLHTFSAHIPAEPAVVFDGVDARLRAGLPAGSAYLSDPQALFIAVQGGWWYRAEYLVIADERGGSRLEHVIVNVAQRGEKAALLTGRKVIEQTPLAFHDLVKRLRAELN